MPSNGWFDGEAEAERNGKMQLSRLIGFWIVISKRAKPDEIRLFIVAHLHFSGAWRAPFTVHFACHLAVNEGPPAQMPYHIHRSQYIPCGLATFIWSITFHLNTIKCVAHPRQDGLLRFFGLPEKIV